MSDFFTLRNFLLALAACVGVILFAVTVMRWIGTNSNNGAKKYTVTQLLMMLLISMVMVSAVTYMDMGSYTFFGSDSYSVAASDPWLVQDNISNIFAQFNLDTNDIDTFAKATTIFFMGMKALGLALFIFTTSAWFRIASGEVVNKTMGGVIFFYTLSFMFWNFGTVIRMVAYQLGYQIDI